MKSSDWLIMTTYMLTANLDSRLREEVCGTWKMELWMHKEAEIIIHIDILDDINQTFVA